MVKSALVLGFTTLLVPAAFGQLQDNRDKQMTCENRGNFRQSRKCDIQEQTLASVGQLTIDPGRNGGVTIKGWTQPNILVRARLEAYGTSDSDANLTFGQLHSDAAAGRIAGTGPSSGNWSISYEIFAPQTQDLKITAYNGGVHVSDISGSVEANTQNGGVHLERVIGNITGKTKNGGIHAQLANANWNGRQLDFETENGGIHIEAPSSFQGHIQGQTVNGGLHSDFGDQQAQRQTTPGARTRPRTLDVTVGGGGATLKVVTKNGGIHIGKPEKVI